MRFLTLILLSADYLGAAISANSVWEVRTAGNDTNGGGFVTGASGTDWSLFNNKNASGCTSCGSTTTDLSVTDGVTAGTTTITSATANFGTSIVGNIIYVQGGTGSVAAGWYQVTARTDASTITVDRSTGLTAGTGVTLNIGGALASPGQAAVNASVAGNTIFIKYNASPYSITSASTGAAGVINNSTAILVSGYDSTRTVCNTDANRPTLQLNVASATLITSSTGVIFCSMILDGNSQTSAKATAGMYGYRVHFANFNTASTGTANCHYCTATANSAAIFTGGAFWFVEMYANTATPLTSGSCSNCVSYNNTGASTDGYTVTGVFTNSIAYGNGRDGFSVSGSGAKQIINCIAEANGRYGFNQGSNTISINNAAYNNTTAAKNGTAIESGFITVTAGSVFTNAGSNNFTLNNTASRGALLRAAGFPATLANATATTNYRDIGVAQHQDPTVASGGAFGYVK